MHVSTARRSWGAVWQLPVAVARDVGAVVGEEVVDHAHRAILGKRRAQAGAALATLGLGGVYGQHGSSPRRSCASRRSTCARLIPEVMKGYAEMSRASMAPGRAVGRDKELLATVDRRHARVRRVHRGAHARAPPARARRASRSPRRSAWRS